MKSQEQRGAIVIKLEGVLHVERHMTYTTKNRIKKFRSREEL
jgi:hypothetical protein